MNERKTIELKKFSIDFVNEWVSLLTKGWNWKEFHILMFRTEIGYMHGDAEVEMYFLGFGFRIYWIWNWELLQKRLKEYDERIRRGKWFELRNTDYAKIMK